MRGSLCSLFLCMMFENFHIKTFLKRDKQHRKKEKKRKKALDIGIKGKRVWKVALLSLYQTQVIHKEDEYPFQIGVALVQRILIL